jgi:hypothetical protein
VNPSLRDRDATGRRHCRWCFKPLPAACRSDAKHCGKPCRQAHHRFQAGRARAAAVQLAGRYRPLRFAYADPPYPGTAARYYREHPDYGGEVDHAELIHGLDRDFPDGWALSTSAAALPVVLASCPPASPLTVPARGPLQVAAWFRGERPTTSHRPLSSWEPVIVRGGREYLSGLEDRRLDSLQYVSRPRLTDRARVVRSKPAAFCWWLFGLLGAMPCDTLVDVFPGSGGVARAWSLLAEPDPQARIPGLLDLFAEYSSDGSADEVSSGAGEARQ